MRLFKGHDIKQISDEAKQGVPDHIKEKAREMARLELARRLEELDMRAGDAKEYGGLLQEVQAHIAQLHDLLESACMAYLPSVTPADHGKPRSLRSRRRTRLGQASNRRRAG